MTSAIMHRRRVAETISPLLGTETRPLADLLAVPRRLAADVVSGIDVPGFDNSSMDGFAIAADTLRTASGRPIPVTGQVAAGAHGHPVAPGTAVEIMTGAPVPPGADTIVPIEATSPGRFGAPEITVDLPAEAVEPGAFVRRRGSDVDVGTTVLTAGAELTPARLGVAAACGVDALDVVTLPRILVLSTGDEVAAGAEAGIHDANGVTLTAGLLRLGAEVERLRVPDDPRLLLEAVAATDADLVVSTGGISKGAREVVRLAADLDPDSAMVFEPIAMQPGGPQGCGRLAGRAWVALPGNPVSALISFEMFLRPALLGLDAEADARPAAHHRLAAGLDETTPAGKLQVRRARLTDDGIVFVGGSRSHLLHSYAESTHLVFLPPVDAPESDRLFAPVGDRLKTWTID
ncbi:molybdopterin molybdotransferase MoeA [Brevibacterium casei]|uniref:molybdopterin molybdotransferase MoeA n=1 Tax=Brevibacterium casei TaxID=33889 RepID=UPI00223ADF59|nr:molybdopterin molybdotransferase MoeA [Brevibacterium casei]MCT2357828.1 molybdopterin molybdotransferase MoeA [Brevibacterium casei]